MPKNSAFCKTSSLIVQLPGRLIRLFLARDVWVPRSVTSPYFALTGQEGNHAMALRPNAYHGGSLGGPRCYYTIFPTSFPPRQSIFGYQSFSGGNDARRELRQGLALRDANYVQV